MRIAARLAQHPAGKSGLKKFKLVQPDAVQTETTDSGNQAIPELALPVKAPAASRTRGAASGHPARRSPICLNMFTRNRIKINRGMLTKRIPDKKTTAGFMWPSRIQWLPQSQLIMIV